MASSLGQFRRAVSLGLIAIRDAIQNRAARPVRIAWIFHRHDALSLADKYALSHDHRRLVADDDARMRRRLDRVPFGQIIASPDRMPRLPSSQLAAVPCRVQACASAGPAPAAASADNRIENTSRRDGHVTPPPGVLPLRQSSASTAFRFSARGSKRPASKASSKFDCLFNKLRKYPRERPHSLAKVAMALQESSIRRDGRVA